MSDDVEAAEGEGDGELRPCSYCGAAIDSRCHRCSDCGGHVGLSWKSVDSEVFGLLFASIVIGVGSIVSWSVERPGTLHGTDTIRGSAMLALSLYGIFHGLLNVFCRRHVVWPTLLNALLALWTGIEGVIGATGSAAWKAAAAKSSKGGGSYFDEMVGNYVRAIPPAFLLLTAAGALVMILIIKGLVAGAGSASAKAKAEQEARDAASADRKAKRFGKSPTDAPPPGDMPAEPPPPIP